MRLARQTFTGMIALALLAAPGFARADSEEDRRDAARPSMGVIVTERDGDIVIAHVIKDGPADEAGLRRGDQIRKLEGERVRSTRDFLSQIRDKDEGDKVELEVRRGDESKTIDVSLVAFREVREVAAEDERLQRMGRAVATQLQFHSLQQQVEQLQRQLRQMQLTIRELERDRGQAQRFGEDRFDRDRRQPQQRYADDRSDRDRGQAQQRSGEDRFDRDRVPSPEDRFQRERGQAQRYDDRYDR